MKRFFQWLVSRAGVFTFLMVCTVFDLTFTIVVLSKLAPSLEQAASAECNPLFRHFITIYGLWYTMALLLPLMMLLVALLIYRFWNTKFLRWPARIYGYALCLTRVVLFLNNCAVVYLLAKEGVI